jgi:pre-rRNA-processing protein TSR3
MKMGNLGKLSRARDRRILKQHGGTLKATETQVVPRVFVLELKQDDPSKNTSAKMRKFGLAQPTTPSRIPREAIVLNPFSDLVLLPGDRSFALRYGLVVIDCSWVHAQEVFGRRFRGLQRRLPALIAGNPTNYSKLGALSSLEATAACLYIMGFQEFATKMLSLYKWGETFLLLNNDPLEEYSRAESQEQVKEIEDSYFGNAKRSQA